MLYGTAEAVPYKDFLVATQALQPERFNLAWTKPHTLKPVPLKRNLCGVAAPCWTHNSRDHHACTGREDVNRALEDKFQEARGGG